MQCRNSGPGLADMKRSILTPESHGTTPVPAPPRRIRQLSDGTPRLVISSMFCAKKADLDGLKVMLPTLLSVLGIIWAS